MEDEDEDADVGAKRAVFVCASKNGLKDPADEDDADVNEEEEDIAS